MPDLDPSFLAGAAAGELRVQRCTDCSTLRFPPSSLCPRCLSFSARWEPVSGRGVIWSWIRMHHKYFRDLDREPPYNVAMIELAEGPLMISAIVDDDVPLTVGAAVRVTFRGEGEHVLPYFTVTEAAA